MATRRKDPVGEPCVALLRGINVGGNKKVPMAQLRVLAQRLGWSHIATHLQSGNLVFVADGDPDAAASALEKAIELHFGFEVPVIVRTRDQFVRAAASCPFADAAAERPNLVHLGFGQKKPRATAAKDLAPYAAAGERLAVRAGAIWIDFASGVARSKLTPAVLDRAIGSTVTLRNMNTVRAIVTLLQSVSPRA